MTKQEVRKLWVAALRSDEYRQTKYVLHSGDNRFCCLGVLCELAVENNIIDSGDLSEDGKCFFYEDLDQVLPDLVQEWAGLIGNEGECFCTDSFARYGRTLSVMNDSGKTFTEIAEAIEKDDSYFDFEGI
jgi:hypothetical protein